MKSATSSTSEQITRALPLGMGYAWLAVLLHFAWLLLVAGKDLSSVWEVQMGLFGLAPAWLLLASVPGALGGAAAAVLLRSEDRRQALTSRLGFSLGILLFGALVAWGVGGGRHLADPAVRGGFALVVGCLGAAIAWLLVPSLRSAARAPAGRLAFAVSVFALVLALEGTNTMVLVRLYPAFHLGLSFLGMFLIGLSGVLLAGTASLERQKRSLWAWLVLALCALLLVPASRAIGGFDNFRFTVVEGSQTLGWGVKLASVVAPPPPLDVELARLPLGARRADRDVNFRGRDIVLISIDALRADHLGAYGYERPTSPAMDELAAGGVRFDAAYAATPHTSYSVTSVMTGKYMRPLLLQGAGRDSDLWSTLLQQYGYRTAGFYPPAVFYIDRPRFERFEREQLGFEYVKVEFAEGQKRLGQVRQYLSTLPSEKNVFLWVHLFGPHEPYVRDVSYDFGPRDIDRYDSEIRAADETVGALVKMVRARDPEALILLTADHGEEFGDHGGRYHGTTVFDEQVRVPLIVAGAGIARDRVIEQPVQTVDLLPTVLSGLDIPIPPRIRGRDLTSLLSAAASEKKDAPGRAVSETDDYTLLAERSARLICQRESGACQLYDVETDPAQKTDVAHGHPDRVGRLRQVARSIAESHGRFESEGLRAEGKGWPTAILLGLSGNADVAPELATLLDDADPKIRQKAAELLFDLGTDVQAPALRLALTREENKDVSAFLALALTRLGQAAPLVYEILNEGNPRMRRLAALALAEQGDSTGEKTLIRWWAQREDLEFEQATRLLQALGRIHAKEAVPLLVGSLSDVRLRPSIAQALADIGDSDAKPYLAAALNKERYQSARAPLARALLRLGADDELIVPLRLFLGVPDPLSEGLAIAEAAGILPDVGGPKREELLRLRQLSDSGYALSVIVPPAPKSERQGVRLLIRARTRSGSAGRIFVQPRGYVAPTKKGPRFRHQPKIQPETALELLIPENSAQEGALADSDAFFEIYQTLPESFGARPGHHLGLELFAPQDVEIDSLAAVPLRSELPPPAPKAWKSPQNTPK